MAKKTTLTAAEALAIVEAFDLETDLESLVENAEDVLKSAILKILAMAGIDTSAVGAEGEEEESPDDEDVPPADPED